MKKLDPVLVWLALALTVIIFVAVAGVLTPQRNTEDLSGLSAPLPEVSGKSYGSVYATEAEAQKACGEREFVTITRLNGEPDYYRCLMSS